MESQQTDQHFQIPVGLVMADQEPLYVMCYLHIVISIKLIIRDLH